MITTQTPYRISFVGGGSDYREWFSRHGGSVVTTTIDKYCHILLRRMPPHLGCKFKVIWSKVETVNRVEDIEHPSVRGCLQYLDIDYGVEVIHAGDLPARSGLGSSSAFTVGMLNALHTMMGESIGRAELAKEAIEVEQDVLEETVGVQDQIECAWGGLNRIDLHKDGSYAVTPILIDAEKRKRLQNWLVLVHTQLPRFASEVAAHQVMNIQRKTMEICELVDLVPEAVSALSVGASEDLGAILHKAWMIKRTLSDKITTPAIDAIYSRARSSGALGGKVLGAGGGGFMLFCVPPPKRQEMLNALGLPGIPVQFSGCGSTVVSDVP